MKRFLLTSVVVFLTGCGKEYEPTPMPHHDPKDEIPYVALPKRMKDRIPHEQSHKAREADAIEARDGSLDLYREYELYAEEHPEETRGKKGIKPLATF